MDINTQKRLAASLSIVSNISLTLLKLIAGIISGSLSIISEAIHSISDFVASLMTLFSVVKSSQPADSDHPYGHGKYEDMSGAIEGILIILAGVYIIYECVQKIIPGTPIEVSNTLGIIVMSVAVVMNFIVSSYLFKIAKESESISLYADGEHLRTDVYSSLGVLLGLILIKITGYTVLDPIIAIMVGTFICKKGYTITAHAVMNLLDHSLSDDEIEKIINIINTFSQSAKLKENSIKTRQSGPAKDINLVLQFPESTTVCECHKICDEIEKQIHMIFANATITIHTEPICYKSECMECGGLCHQK